MTTKRFLIVAFLATVLIDGVWTQTGFAQQAGYTPGNSFPRYAPHNFRPYWHAYDTTLGTVYYYGLDAQDFANRSRQFPPSAYHHRSRYGVHMVPTFPYPFPAAFPTDRRYPYGFDW